MSIPTEFHLVFENGLFLGGFKNEDAADRFVKARVAAGKNGMQRGKYLLTEGIQLEREDGESGME